MPRLLSSKAQERKDIGKSSKTCNVGIQWKALTEYSQMRTHVPAFQYFNSFFSIILYWPFFHFKFYNCTKDFNFISVYKQTTK